MVRAIIFGATGYTGIELIRLLASHPEATIVAGASRQWAGKKVREVLPYIPTDLEFPLVSIDELVRGQVADVAFLALPHGAAGSLVRPLLDQGIKVVDLSADYRLHDSKVYAEWYGDHPDPDILDRAVYGLPEIHRESIKSADLVANPGCYPTSVILGLMPLLNQQDVDARSPIVDSKSGISGAGRGAKLSTSYCEAGEGFKPYTVIGHRHVPEMEQELTQLQGSEVKVRFTPHLIPVSRGMISTMYLPLVKDISSVKLRADFEQKYEQEPFVRILPAGVFPDTAQVRGSNMCHISVEVDDRMGLVIVMSAIDNLVKGAAGQAVQNMNLIVGLDETTGLLGLPLYP